MTHQTGLARAARRTAALLVVAAAAAAPRAAHACFVCMTGRNDASTRAFAFGSVLLSVLPFALFGGIGAFVWRRMRADEVERAQGAQPELREKIARTASIVSASDAGLSGR